jgi:hypothetical protein
MTRNTKVVLGVAAGVAALAVAGMYAKKKGYLNNINTDGLKDKWNGVKDTAMKAFGHKSSEMSSESNSSMNMSSTDNSTNGSSKKKGSSSSMNTGNMGNINPATT